MTPLRRHPVVFGIYVLVVIVCIGLLVTGASDSGSDPATPESADEPHTLELVVRSTGSEPAALSYLLPSVDPFNTERQTDVRLPWRKVIRGVERVRAGLNLKAIQSGSGRLSCTILLDGEPIATDTSGANPSLVTCAPG
jgi:hypothetical protein